MDSFFSLLQNNVLNTRRWATREELRLAIVTWIGVIIEQTQSVPAEGQHADMSTAFNPLPVTLAARSGPV
jgi:hypothetical protein